MTHFVSRQWLLENLNNPHVVVVDCRFELSNPEWGYQQYLQSHIPGAYYLDLDQDLSSPIQKHGGRHPQPNPEQLAEKLATMGVNWGETLVVSYDHFRCAFAARLWWLLRYFGHEKVALLDGGWHGWCGDDYPVTDELPQIKSGHFIPQLQSDWLVDIETLKARKDSPGVILVDSRDNYRYRGESEPIDPIAGHIPPAINLPWKEVTDEQGNLLPISQQQQRWQPYKQASEIIVYCGSGVTACVNLFSLSLVGINQGKLYAGGWSDWSSYLEF